MAGTEGSEYLGGENDAIIPVSYEDAVALFFSEDEDTAIFGAHLLEMFYQAEQARHDPAA